MMASNIWEALLVMLLGSLSCATQENSCRGHSCEDADVSSLLQVSLQPTIAANGPTHVAKFTEEQAATTDLPKDAAEWSGMVIDVGLVSTGSCSMVKAMRDLGLDTRHVAVDIQETVEAGTLGWSTAQKAIHHPPETRKEDEIIGKNFVHFVSEMLFTQQNNQNAQAAIGGTPVEKCKYIEDFARQGYNFLADVPFSFPSTFNCMNRFNAINKLAGKPKIVLVASQRARKHWVDSLLTHQWKGGPMFRAVWNMPHTSLKTNFNLDQPNLTAPEYGSIWDVHHGLLVKHNVTEVALEVSDSKKWNALCSVMKGMGSIFEKCVNHSKTVEKYPFWVPKFQETPRSFDPNILWQQWTTKLGVPHRTKF